MNNRNPHSFVIFRRFVVSVWARALNAYRTMTFVHDTKRPTALMCEWVSVWLIPTSPQHRYLSRLTSTGDKERKKEKKIRENKNKVFSIVIFSEVPNVYHYTSCDLAFIESCCAVSVSVCNVHVCRWCLILYSQFIIEL